MVDVLVAKKRSPCSFFGSAANWPLGRRTNHVYAVPSEPTNTLPRVGVTEADDMGAPGKR